MFEEPIDPIADVLGPTAVTENPLLTRREYDVTHLGNDRGIYPIDQYSASLKVLEEEWLTGLIDEVILPFFAFW